MEQFAFSVRSVVERMRHPCQRLACARLKNVVGLIDGLLTLVGWLIEGIPRSAQPMGILYGTWHRPVATEDLCARLFGISLPREKGGHPEGCGPWRVWSSLEWANQRWNPDCGRRFGIFWWIGITFVVFVFLHQVQEWGIVRI